MQKSDDWTIDRWKTDHRLVAREFTDRSVEQAPPLWKDMAIASALALILWGAAVVMFA